MTDGPSGEVVVHVDARGTRCPVPVLRLAAAVRGLPAGTTASVQAEDPAVEHDVPAWAGMRGHQVLRVEQEDGVWLVVVRTGGRSSAAAAGPPVPPAGTRTPPG